MLSCFSHVWRFGIPGTVACQALLSIFFRQEYWSGLLCPPPGDLPDPGIKPMSSASPAFQADSLLLSHWGSPHSSVGKYNWFVNMENRWHCFVIKTVIFWSYAMMCHRGSILSSTSFFELLKSLVIQARAHLTFFEDWDPTGWIDMPTSKCFLLSAKIKIQVVPFLALIMIPPNHSAMDIRGYWKFWLKSHSVSRSLRAHLWYPCLTSHHWLKAKDV